MQFFSVDRKCVTQILLLCLQKQLQAGHSKGMTLLVLRVLQNSKEKGSFASGANFNIKKTDSFFISEENIKPT